VDNAWGAKAFKIVVSDKRENKLGVGGTTQKTTRTLYFYAERLEEGDIFIQPLSAKYCPSGEKTPVVLEEFLDNFRPEPLYYYNRVKPAMDGLETRLEKGEEHLEAGRPDLAEKSFKRALEMDEDNVRGVFGLGTAYLDAEKQEEAEAILGRIMTLDMAFHPDHIHLFNSFGIKMRKASMHQQALDYYARALALNARDENLHFNTCRIHYEMGDLDNAMECVVEALRINQDFAEAEQMLAHLLRKKPALVARLAQRQEGENGEPAKESGPTAPYPEHH